MNHKYITRRLSTSRTINSLIKCLHEKLFPEIIFYIFFSSNKSDYMTWDSNLHSYIIEKNITIVPVHSYQDVIHHVDVVYITRPQTERHNIKYDDSLTITPRIMDQMKETAIVMPLSLEIKNYLYHVTLIIENILNKLNLVYPLEELLLNILWVIFDLIYFFTCIIFFFYLVFYYIINKWHQDLYSMVY